MENNEVVEKKEAGLEPTNSQSKYYKEVTLPSGKTLQVIKPKGKHLRQAAVLMDGRQEYMMFAFAATFCRINDEKFVMEDLDEMDFEDVYKIQSVVGEFLL